MTKYSPKIRLSEGDVVSFDELTAHIQSRKSNDEFVVELSDGTETWHIDRFTRMGYEADRVIIHSERP